MRKTKQIVVESKTYTIKELSLRQILALKEKVKPEATIDEIIKLSISEVSDIPQEALLDFTFSDLEALVQAIKDVNNSFFKIPEHLGLKEIAEQMLQKIKEAILIDWTKSMMR